MIRIYCDGACSGNPGPGGWAVLITNGKVEKTFSGSKEQATNQQMELIAAINGIVALGKEPRQAELITDSKMIVDAFNNDWIERWQRNGWHTANRTPVSNRELWEKLVELANTHQIKFTWTKGHAGDQHNEKVNELAQQESLKAKASLPKQGKSTSGISEEERILIKNLITLGFSGELVKSDLIIIIDEYGEVNVVQRSAACL